MVLLRSSADDGDEDGQQPQQQQPTEKKSVQFRYHTLTDVERILCLSDLHTDHADNLRWLRERARSELRATDLLVVAGDVSHDASTFAESLAVLCDECRVLFVPGNHEAWLSRTERRQHDSSLDKLAELNRICRSHSGAYVDPVYVPMGAKAPVWILPLESWYDGTLSFDEDLCAGFEHWPWVDFVRCKWNFPSAGAPNHRIPLGLTEYFLERNEKNILMPWRDLLSTDPSMIAPVVTVSHFAPNQQCLPDWKDLSARSFQVDRWLDHGAGAMSAKFAKVAGTALLDDQLRTIQTERMVHIFGHSHRPKDFEFGGIRYVHNPLGKPRERQLYMVSPHVTFKCIWDANAGGEVEGDTVIRLWEEQGGGKEMLLERMKRIRPGRYQRERRRR
jgi:predicted phosphodiesterase